VYHTCGAGGILYDIPVNVIYTAIFGKIDPLYLPPFLEPNWDFICFTDDMALSREHTCVRYIDKPMFQDPCRSAKIFKILPHMYLAKYEYSLWIDSNVIITGEVFPAMEHYMNMGKKMVLHRHPTAECAYDEAQACIQMNKDDPGVIRAHVQRIKNSGYPAKNGMGKCTVLLRKHMDLDVIRVDETWWNEIRTGSRRDQISFNYSCWKHNFEPAYFEWNILYNDYFHWQKEHGDFQ
jgi:hypothetical protein